MSNNAGNIAVGLVLNGADAFVGRVNSSAKSLDKYGSSAKVAEVNTQSWLHQTRDAVIVLGLARSAVENLSMMLTSIPRSIIKQNAQLERSQILIAGMDKSADSYAEAMARAQKTVGELVDMSSSSPFSVDSIADSFAKLSAADIQNTASALDALVNASAKAGTNSEGLKRASVALSQMAGKGVISMEELRQQLGESIPTAMQLMANATGMRMGDMVKKISTGTMEARSALDELFKEMSFSSMGAAEAMAQSIEGIENRIRNDFTRLSKVVGDNDFTKTYKEIGNELDEILSSQEVINFAKDLGSALATVTEELFDISKAIASNSKEIGFLIAAMASMKILTGAQNKLAIFWNEAETAGKKYSNNVERYTRRTEALIQKHNEAIIANQQKIAQRYTAQSSAALSTQFADAYRKYEEHLNKVHYAQIEKIQAAQKAYTSTSARVISSAKGMFNAMGGWTTLVTAGIAGAIYLMDEFIFKQQRAAENIIRNQGLGATVEQLSDAKEELQSIGKNIKEYERLIEIADKQAKTDPTKKPTAQLYRSYLEGLKKDYKVLEGFIDTSTQEILNVAKETGESRAGRLMQMAMSGISTKYQAETDKLRKTLEEKGLKGEDFTKAFKPEIEKLRANAISELESAAEVEKAKIKESIALLKKDPNTGLYSDKDAKSLAEYRGALQGLDDLVKKHIVNIKTGNVESLSMTNAQLSAEDKLMNKLKLNEELYKHRLARIKDETKYGEYRIRLEEDIATEKYKNSNADLDAMRKQADATDRAIAAYKAEQAEIAKKKALLQDIEQVNKRLDSMLISMAKKVGTSQGQSLNEFMKWKVSADQNTEAIAQMRKQLEKVNSGKLTKKQEDGLAELSAMAKQINLNNIIAQQKEYQNTLDDSSLNQMQLYVKQTEKTKSDLKEVRASLESQLATMQMNTAEYWKTQDAIDAVNQSLKMAEAEAKRINPRTDAWDDFSRQIDDMNNQIDDQLVKALDGAMDGLVDSMWDASASFSDSIDSMIKDLGKFITKMLIAKAVQDSLNMMFSSSGSSGSAATGATAAQGTSVTGMSAVASFAKGGIMTEYGSVPLRKYANGGIATSPQLALFGEGSHNEAYVPLPDGRSIPVTMTNDNKNAPAPVVNVINQTGTQAEVESSSSFDGERWITDVVMKAASRPGKFRDAMGR